jgi:hypothetical protein
VRLFGWGPLTRPACSFLVVWGDARWSAESGPLNTSKTGGSAGNRKPGAATRAPDGRWDSGGATSSPPDGPDATVVTEIYDCLRAPEEARAGMDNGKVWIEAMAKTLERLDALCARQGHQPGPS